MQFDGIDDHGDFAYPIVLDLRKDFIISYIVEELISDVSNSQKNMILANNSNTSPHI